LTKYGENSSAVMTNFMPERFFWDNVIARSHII